MRVAPVKQRRKKYLILPQYGSAEGRRPVMLALLLGLLGRPLDWGLWAGGAKWCISGMFPRNRRMLRVGCPR